jgi:hypothetical protein
MRNPLRYGNKAALIVGVLLMLVDNIPLAHEFGAWNIGALLCVWYSATAIHEDTRIGRRIKYGLYVYLVIVLVLVVSLHDSSERQTGGASWSIHPALRAIGIGTK